MKWNGKELVYKEDWAEALSGLVDADDAQLFLNLYGREQPCAESILGYLTGELPAEEGARARRLLRVPHPIVDDFDGCTPEQLLEFGIRAARTDAAWFFYAAAIPRRNPLPVRIVHL
jgi:hypothetical protein